MKLLKLSIWSMMLLLLFSGCGGNSTMNNQLEPFSDVRYFEKAKNRRIYQPMEYVLEDISTYTFNEGTILVGAEELQKQILENGKNPGLGIRSLHKQGITGKGVRVAILDQPLFLDHPEYSDTIAAYYDTGCGPQAMSSMHGPAVLSILAGKNIGVAPDAQVFYAAVPSWNQDSGYYAKGLQWIMDMNKMLPAEDKIRVVSVSAAPSGKGSDFSLNTELWEETVHSAQAEGILVLDCDPDSLISAAVCDPNHPEEAAWCSGGFLSHSQPLAPGFVGVPAARRTVAEEYIEGSFSYAYMGNGGLSLGIPYAVGILALGWQVNPVLSGEEMLRLLSDTAEVGKDGSRIANPASFITAVEKTKK
ncbi:S8/S53 family peptidase [Holdemania massiliensis]|uniref:S8/S53 family peptidase n=1 Tax=Holdemania massiliensis TaxID=1468449 RepID=UPI001F06D431|nr:S8/S53 family peptidase [Holdemania massiliensis]MCH1939840.1 S8/S53 family peptidase [Holdemania massiliensis]